ncbi:MAG: DUF1501 domain-containing protein [Candidatus Binataceae bacterium]|jgi:uncharacterized protein (DUF1501 family)
MNRRQFLKRAAMLSASGVVMLSGGYGWAARVAGDSGTRKRLIVIFLRGAVDGLNVVIPHGEPAYYDSRPTIAIGRAGGADSVLNLDGHFGLHPALAPIMPLWSDGTLAFVHACGSPDPSRSHFDAQEYMESGTPGVRTTPDGWMNRVLAAMPGRHDATEALSVGPTLPRILSGRMPVANVPTGRAAGRPMPVDRPRIEAAFDRLYSGADPLSRAYQEGNAARKKLLADLAEDMKIADAGAPQPYGFSDDTARLAQLINRDPTVRLAFLAVGGWDTHINQGAANGQLANHLRPLAEGYATLAKGLGSAWGDTVVITMSEFGRTMRENGNGGTDHGHGNVMWIAGGNVRGRQVYGRWPGLSGSGLYQGRDLAITTDFRSVAAAVLERHMGLDRSAIGKVFPGFSPATDGLSGMIRA